MFLNSIMLIGVAAAVVPLVLHLLSRARYKDVDWGAMMFLEGTDVHKRQSSRFTQMLLLLLRSVVIALLALAMARPIARGKWAGQESGNRMTAALILDCSASMGFDENGRSRFQMAQTAARQIIRGLRPGDRVSLILMGAPHAASDLDPTGDLRAVEARIDEARLSNGTASLRDALDTAATILERNEKSARDVYVVCDRQALSWQGVDERFSTEWRNRMYGPGLSTRVFVLPVGSGESDNIAVESVKLLNPPAIVGQPSEVEIVVRNYGPVQHAAVPVSIDGNHVVVPPRAVSLAPNQSFALNTTVTFGQTGSQVLTASVKSSGYVGDDHLDLAVNVIAPIRVLVISGDERAGQFRSESAFIKWALSPHRSAGVQGVDPCTVTIVPAQNWTTTDLRKFQVVVLANVERFTPQQRLLLEKYVYNGGGLFVAPGNLSRVDDYNAQLYKEGAGILPAMLHPPTAADGSDATSLLSMQTDHPAFHFLRGRSEIPQATITRYFPTTPRQVGADVLARYLNNDPFLIEGRSESTHVLLMTTALDADWSTLPLSNFYLPFVQSSVRYLADASVTKGNLSPGEEIRLTFDDARPKRRVSILRPDGQTVKVDIVHLDNQPRIRYGDTELPGTYHVKVEEPGKAAQTLYFIVRPPHEESDLTQLTDEKWQQLESAIGFSRIDPSGRPVLETLAANREGREMWGPALAMVLALAAAELALARAASVQRKAAERKMPAEE